MEFDIRRPATRIRRMEPWPTIYSALRAMLCRPIPVTNWNLFTWDANTFQLDCGLVGQEVILIHLLDF